MTDLSLIQIINGNNYLNVNRSLAHKIGLNEAIILSELCDKYDFFLKDNSLITIDSTCGWFYLTMEKIYERTTLTKRQQIAAINRLVELRLIKTRIFGQPSKKYFFIDQNEILALLVVDSQRGNGEISKKESRCNKMSHLAVTKCHSKQLQNVTPIYKEQNPRSKNPEVKKDIVSLKSAVGRTLEPKRKYKLDDEQQGVVDWLKDRLEKTNEDTLCFWAKSYEFDNIEAAYLEAKSRNPDNLGAYINKLLKSGAKLGDSLTKKCKEFAEDFVEASGWGSTKIIKDFFVYFDGKMKQEISLNQDPDNFSRQLLSIYSHLKTKNQV